LDGFENWASTDAEAPGASDEEIVKYGLPLGAVPAELATVSPPDKPLNASWIGPLIVAPPVLVIVTVS
jgi:hypothetical protein